METATNNGVKLSVDQARASVEKNESKTRNALTRADYGLHLTGMVDACSEVTHRQGTTEKGKSWSFYQQVIGLAVGGELYEITYRTESDPGVTLCPYELDDKVRIKVENPRSYNGKVTFDACKV